MLEPIWRPAPFNVFIRCLKAPWGRISGALALRQQAFLAAAMFRISRIALEIRNKVAGLWVCRISSGGDCFGYSTVTDFARLRG